MATRDCLRLSAFHRASSTSRLLLVNASPQRLYPRPLDSQLFNHSTDPDTIAGSVALAYNSFLNFFYAIRAD